VWLTLVRNGSRRKPDAKMQRKPPSFWKRCRYRLEAVALELLAATIPLLSRKALLRVANGLGWLAFHLLRRERRVALTNLDIAFGPGKSTGEKKRIALSSFQNFARSFLGLFWAQRLDGAALEKWLEVDEESVRRAREIQARGKGIILITLHYGEWELLGLATAWLGFPMTVVAEQTRNPHLERIFSRLRGHTGNRSILQRFAVTKLFKALKRGECVGLLIDLNAPQGRGGIWLDFFGLPVFSNSSAAGLALRSGAAIVGTVAHPLPDGRVRIVYRPEVPVERTGDRVADLKAISQRCLDSCEAVIRQRPEFWLWFYRRWKFRPSEEKSNFPYYSIYHERLRLPRAQKGSANQSPSVPQQGGP
jgi:Kdo2-lipid IVA lauroyltransferase/acyltransferase